MSQSKNIINTFRQFAFNFMAIIIISFVDFTGDFLVAKIGERLMLRGFFTSPVSTGRYFTYTDVSPFIKQIIAKSTDMYLMPKVPEAKNKTGEL